MADALHRAPRIAVLMPRNLHFGPRMASSIDLCAYDFVRRSRYLSTTVVVAEEVDVPFAGVPVALYARKDRRAQLAAVRAHRPDLVVVHQHAPTAARIASSMPGVPVLLHRHNMVKSGSGVFARARRAWRFRRLAGVIFVSEWARGEFRVAWPNGKLPLHMVHNALEMSRWRPRAVRDRVVAFTARAAPNKGAAELAEALARVLPDAPGWGAHLLLSASSAHPDVVAHVRAALAPFGGRARIELDRPFDEVVALLTSCAIAVTPTIETEAFGRAALEAMAGGAALISSTTGGLPEVIGDTAIALDAVTVDALEAALRELIGDEALRDKFAAAARARAENLFDLDVVTARLDDVYEETVVRARAR
jgi:glycosyltransferase involved in cell wall biosynthesis